MTTIDGSAIYYYFNVIAYIKAQHLPIVIFLHAKQVKAYGKSNPNETNEIRTLVDNLFALQWCRENIVVPLGTERNQATGTEKLTVALGNIAI